ncbi:MAG TPA: hypothetical protein VFH56_10020 [Acidimicrobiales bacterium]|nr:hypothetical protein [Acidimicrobiales bacterium]
MAVQTLRSVESGWISERVELVRLVARDPQTLAVYESLLAPGQG